MPSLPANTSAEAAALSARRHTEPLLRFDAARHRPPLWSAGATWRDLTETTGAPDPLRLAPGWTRQWTLTHRNGDTYMETDVESADVVALLDADPIRTPTWHPNATARAGLHYVNSTGDLHLHESLFERNLLLALDFHGVVRVASQPFTLTWHDGHAQRKHTPDFLVETEQAVTVVNVRPAHMVKDALREDCAAVAELSLTHGWHHALVTGYPRPAFTNLAHVAAHRSAQDRTGYAGEILDELGHRGPMPFASLADTFDGPVVARSIIQRLIWDREVSIDLNHLLHDDTLVALPGEEVQS